MKVMFNDEHSTKTC